jgi:predicted nucleic acid-binding protein
VRAILDTNVWLDWLVFADPRVAPLAASIEAGVVAALATEPMLAEFAAVVARPQFALDERARAHARARQRDAVRVVAPAPDCRLPCTDPDDRMFVDLAVAHRVDWLVSRDKALLRLGRIASRRFGVHIATPEAWHAALSGPRL